MRNKANREKYQSFRVQIAVYCLISMVLAAVTMLVLTMAFYGIFAIIRNGGEAGRAAGNAVLNGAGMRGVNDAGTWGSASVTEESFGQETGGQKNMAVPENAGSVDFYFADKGAVYIQIGGAAGIRLRRGAAVVLAVLALGSALFFFLLYFLLLTRKLSDYLEEIAGGIRHITAGELGTRIPLRQSNELTQIADSFNRMAQELEHTAQEERRAEREKNDLIASIAHDLRTPLTSVIGYLELVAERDLSAETREHYVSVAYRKAKRLQRLTDDLFSYIRYGSERLALKLADLDVVKLVEQMIEEFYPNIQENHLELSVEKKVEQAWVEADGMMLARAFANLLGNAIKYGRDGKSLRVLLDRNQNRVGVHIVNYGEVIPEKDLANIFERFYRVDASRTEEQGGTGLGLAIAKNIIELHHGTIAVKSDSDGTEFTVELPLREQEEIS